MLAFKTLRPLLNRVVVKKAEALTKTKGGIILTSGKEERLNFGTVMAVGPGKSLDDGSVRANLVKIGDTVLLPEYGGSKVILADEEELFIYRDDDIMGTLHDPTDK
jgi:chaperonin GroES